MREAVGADKQKMAVAMVKAAVALWDSLGAVPQPLLLPWLGIAGAPFLVSERKATRGATVSSQKVALPSPSAFHKFKNPSNGM
jgi:hypothetical protein